MDIGLIGTGLCMSIAAVSYTHLDVYKRQGLQRVEYYHWS